MKILRWVLITFIAIVILSSATPVRWLDSFPWFCPRLFDLRTVYPAEAFWVGVSNACTFRRWGVIKQDEMIVEVRAWTTGGLISVEGKIMDQGGTVLDTLQSLSGGTFMPINQGRVRARFADKTPAELELLSLEMLNWQHVRSVETNGKYFRNDFPQGVDR